jgi:hypothetical protein
MCRHWHIDIRAVVLPVPSVLHLVKDTTAPSPTYWSPDLSVYCLSIGLCAVRAILEDGRPCLLALWPIRAIPQSFGCVYASFFATCGCSTAPTRWCCRAQGFMSIAGVAL